LKIRDRVYPRLDDIVEIEVHGLPVLASVLVHHNPKTPLEAKFSMEFCVSAALFSGELGILHFEKEAIFNPSVRALMKKVKTVPDEEMEKVSREQEVLSPIRLSVKLKDGEAFSETVWEAKGSPSHPMSRDEIAKKFRECAQKTISASNVETILKKVDELETLTLISELTSFLVSPKNERRNDLSQMLGWMNRIFGGRR